MTKLVLHVRKIQPGRIACAPREVLRVLVGNEYVKRTADEVRVGDLIAAQGVVTRIETEVAA